MEVPEHQVIYTTTLRLFSVADECEGLSDVAMDGRMDLDGLVVMENEHKRMGERTKTDVFGILDRRVPMSQTRSYESSVGECVIALVPGIGDCFRQ